MIINNLEIECFVVNPLQVNCYVISCKSSGNAAIIDPGEGNQDIVSYISERQIVPKMILNTHGHLDHVAGNKFYKEPFSIPIVIHKADEHLLTANDTMLSPLFPDYIPAKADSYISDDQTININDSISIKVIETPGHTQGSVCFAINNIIFSGDTLFRGSIGRTDLLGGDPHQLLASIKQRLLPFPDDTICFPGHGEHTTIGYEKRNNPFLL